MTDQEQSDAWAALDTLVGKLPLHQFAALRKAVEKVALLRNIRQPQTPETGIGAIIGKWPGNETDEAINKALEELS